MRSLAQALLLSRSSISALRTLLTHLLIVVADAESGWPSYKEGDDYRSIRKLDADAPTAVTCHSPIAAWNIEILARNLLVLDTN